MITIKDIKDCPDIIFFQNGAIYNPTAIYERILIGDSVEDEYTFYADEKWKKRAQEDINKVIIMLDKVRVAEGLEPTGEIKGIPMHLRYMADFIVVDGIVEKR